MRFSPTANVIFFLLLSSCALIPQKRFAGPVYLSSEGKEGYAFAILLTRHLERKNREWTRDAAVAHSHIHLQGPRCRRSTLLRNQDGSRTDFHVRCVLNYRITGENLVKEGVSVASDYLIRTPNLSNYYRREEELIRRLKEQLAARLIRVLERVS